MSDPTPRPSDAAFSPEDTGAAAEDTGAPPADTGSGYRPRSPKMAAAVALVAALVAAVALMFQSGGGEGPVADAPGAAGSDQAAASQQEAIEALAALARRDPDDPLARGAVDAPVVMIEYSDFQCPYCGRYARDTAPELVERYVDAGLLRMEWRDFPYLGEESLAVAVAARAAGEQQMFWEFHHAFFAAQPSPNSGEIDTAWLVERARDAGLDTDRFTADLDDPALRERVERDAREGQQIGVSGTPAFLINGHPIIGAQPTEAFVQVIEQVLETAS
jgi:protein-disulfide isomerase